LKTGNPETISILARNTVPTVPDERTAANSRMGRCHLQFSLANKGAPPARHAATICSAVFRDAARGFWHTAGILRSAAI
jgi:hypothetical protein